MRYQTAALIALGLGLTGCATETVPACRAPQAHEMAAFSAIISHNENALAQAVAPGPMRTAITSREPTTRSYIWGGQGETRGTMLGLLSRPPLCVLDDPTQPATETVRHVLVYPQASFDRVGPAAETPLADAPPPYGVNMRDYLSCRFEQTSEGWKLADLCGYTPRTYTPVTG
ncbi:hypothetical protein [Maricaulis sp. CAU 1757]